MARARRRLLIVDGYNVLRSGVPNAIRIFNEEVLPRGHRPAGIRIDSGDIAYLSKQARKMLDEAEQKVVCLTKGADGAPVEAPFAAEE